MCLQFVIDDLWMDDQFGENNVVGGVKVVKLIFEKEIIVI